MDTKKITTFSRALSFFSNTYKRKGTTFFVKTGGDRISSVWYLYDGKTLMYKLEYIGFNSSVDNMYIYFKIFDTDKEYKLSPSNFPWYENGKLLVKEEFCNYMLQDYQNID